MHFNLPGMDTRTLSEEGVPLVIRGTNGAPIEAVKGQPLVITVKGPDSAIYRGLTRQSIRRRVQRAAGESDLSFEDEEAEITSLLAACVVSWSGLFDTDGKPVPLSLEAATELLTGYPLIRDQVDNFMASRANFTMAS